MRIQLATLAMTALVLAPFAAAAERETMLPLNQVQGGMKDSDSQAATENASDRDIVNAEIVEINGDRLIAEADNGQEFVLLVGDLADDFNIGDELELRLDNQRKTVVILNVMPQDEDEDEDEETES